MLNSSRRRCLLAAAGAIAAGTLHAARNLIPTPAQMMGPFYPDEPPLDQDNDLTRVRGARGTAEGKIAEVSGRLLDPNGNPVCATRIEIWQCDARGFYHHPRDRAGPRDAAFQGFGHTLTDNDGRYRFRTIKPVPYPGRTPHIHFKVFLDQTTVLTGQLFFPDEVSDQVYATGIPYVAREGRGALRNDNDGIAQRAGERALAQVEPLAEGYLVQMILGVEPIGTFGGMSAPSSG